MRNTVTALLILLACGLYRAHLDREELRKLEEAKRDDSTYAAITAKYPRTYGVEGPLPPDSSKPIIRTKELIDEIELDARAEELSYDLYYK